MLEAVVAYFPHLADEVAGRIRYWSRERKEALDRALWGLKTRGLCTEAVLDALLLGHSPLVVLDDIDNLFTMGVEATPDTVILLAHHQALPGRIDAAWLFHTARYSFTEGSESSFVEVASLFSLPLIRAIFDARRWVDSDYSVFEEPIKMDSARELIALAMGADGSEGYIRTWYNLLVTFRPIPASLRRMDATRVDIGELIADTIGGYLSDAFNRRLTRSQLTDLRRQVEQVRSVSASALFEDLKFSIATTWVAEDLSVMHSYDDLMDTVFHAMSSPIPDVSLRLGRAYECYSLFPTAGAVSSSPASDGDAARLGLSPE